MKKGFAVGTLVDRLRKKRSVDESTVTEKLELARSDVDDAERIFCEVRSQNAYQEHAVKYLIN